MLLELQLLYNGHLHDVITNFVHFGYTDMTNLTSNSLKDPFKQQLSESMFNFLGRFCARIQREYFFLLLTYVPKIGIKDIPLPRVIMQHIFSFVLPENRFLEREWNIDLRYRQDCKDPATRLSSHSYPEVRAVLYLMRSYETTSVDQRKDYFWNRMFTDNDSSSDEETPPAETETLITRRRYNAFLYNTLHRIEQTSRTLQSRIYRHIRPT